MSSTVNGSTSSFRHPHRISITLPQQVFETLLERSLQEGRSLSNLGAYLLEWSLHRIERELDQHGPHHSRLI